MTTPQTSRGGQRQLAETLAEFMRILDRMSANLDLIKATNDAWRTGYCPPSNGHLSPRTK
jgi:hypothetical protein